MAAILWENVENVGKSLEMLEAPCRYVAILNFLLHNALWPAKAPDSGP
jgi:hypothetical protein